MSDTHLELLSGAFGQELVCAAPPSYLEEPRGKFHAPSAPLIRPREVREVSAILEFCNAHLIPVIPYAGGTGLVGGQLQDGGGVALLSVERMNKIRDIHAQENVIIAEAGVVLADIQTAAADADRLFPLSLAAEGSCRIGGNLATNAGGVQVLRYGNARDLCLGLEAVLPDGSIHHGLKRLRKDNTGYDLRHLMIGSEGSLGVITAAALKLFPKPREVVTGFLSIASPAAAIQLLTHLQGAVDNAVSAFELIHRTGIEFLRDEMPEVRLPFDAIPQWSVLFEVTGGTGANLQERLEDALIEPIEAEIVTDALIAQSESQRTEFWTVRESIPLANKKIGAICSHDISIPIGLIPEFINVMPAQIAKLADLRINCFGHVGDGNLHYNIYPPRGRNKSDFMHLQVDITRAIHDQVHAMDGSVSAEHGIGRLKADDLERYGDPAKLAAMRAIKVALDPNGIMNPGAVLRET